MTMELLDANDPMLRNPTRDYDPSEIKDLKPLIDGMLDMVRDLGIGLAAPQIGVDRSIFVISIDGKDCVFINPSILSTTDTMSVEEEGCLSLPGLRLRISRPTGITVTWIDETGERKIADMEGLWARCWLHEYDHLQGILMDDRVSKLHLNMAKKKMMKKRKIRERSPV